MWAIVTKIGGYFVSKSIPWKWIGIAAGALVIVGVMVGGYAYVSNMQDELSDTKSALASEKVLRLEEKARADEILVQHDAQILRLDALESQRTAISSEVLTLRKTIEDMDIEEDIAGDNEGKAQTAVTTFNARNAGLNRLLERTSRRDEVHSDPGAGSKASAPGAPSALRRALQALW